MVKLNEELAPLRKDIRLLGEMLGRTLKSQAGDELYELVEEIRTLSKASRTDADADAKLRTIIRGLTDEDTLTLARAFGHFLNMANIAENYHTMRCHRNHAEDALTDQYSMLEELLPRLVQQGVSKDRILETISSMEIELVLTAHPTEVKRRTLIQKSGKISDLLAKRDRLNLTPHEKSELRDDLEILITAIWQTDEIRRVRPTPVEEAKWGMAIIEEILWEAVPRYMRSLDNVARKLLGEKLPIDLNLNGKEQNRASWYSNLRLLRMNMTSPSTATRSLKMKR